MPDYSKGKIYKIINTQNEIIYIGSTIQQLSCRFSHHLYKGNGNKIILIEDCPCSCKEELVRKEQEYIDQHSKLLNKFRAYRSDEYYKEYTKKRHKEYKENNKDKLKDYNKIYRINNLDKLKEKEKQYRIDNKEKEKERHNIYYEKNKEKIKEYRSNNQEKIKEYRINNKEKQKERDKERYQKNKKELSKKVKCDLCNAEVTKQGLTEHKKRKKCINNRINCD